KKCTTLLGRSASAGCDVRGRRIQSQTWRRLMRHLINWLLSALAVWVVAQFVHGFHVKGIAAALVAALVIGFVNATLGMLLKLVTLPLTILTLGIFWLVINALMW